MRKIAAAIVMPLRYPAPLTDKHFIPLVARAPVGGAIGVALAPHDYRCAAADAGTAGAAVYGVGPAPCGYRLGHQAAGGVEYVLQPRVGEVADRLEGVNAGLKTSLALEDVADTR